MSEDLFKYDESHEKSSWVKTGKTSSWWDRGYDYRSYSYSKGSGSRSWMSKVADNDDLWRPKKDPSKVYQNILDQLQNSANLIGENSQKISVHWSNGENVNEVKDSKNGQHIYLSPDNLLSTTARGSNEVSEEILDAMTGKVYLASMFRETVSPKAYGQAQIARKEAKNPSNKKKEVFKDAVRLWEVVETSIARAKIMEDWFGFGPYIAKDAERSSATKSQVQAFLDMSVISPTPTAAVTAIAWDILNPNEALDIPKVYEKCVDEAAKMMGRSVKAADRFSSCMELAEMIHKIIKLPKAGTALPASAPKSGTGDASAPKGKRPISGKSPKSEGKGEEKGKSGSKTPKEKPSPDLCDGSLLGKTVQNKTDSELGRQMASDAASKSEEEKLKEGIYVPPPSGVSDNGKRYRLLKHNGTRHSESYREVVMDHRSEIYAIKSSLMFRNNVNNLVSYGHRSGELDDNSLFKLRLNDDRLMTKRDLLSSSKIAICLLVDESGSMCENDRYQEARNVAIIMAESLKGMEGISVSIYGHTTDDGYDEQVELREYYSPRQRNLESCMSMGARYNNLDSWAIMHTANLFNRDYYDHERKILFVISDGQPAGQEYGDEPAMKHMLEVGKACRRKGIEVYGIGIDEAYSQSEGKAMYGDGGFVVLEDVHSSLGVMSRFIRQVAMK